MSEKIININEWRAEKENKAPEETLKLPNKVYKANWRDDVPDEAEDEIKEVTSFEPFENEQEYKSNKIVSREAENLIDVFKLSREKKREYGRKVEGVLTLSDYRSELSRKAA